MSIFHFQKISDRENGLPKYLPILFSGIEITSNELIDSNESNHFASREILIPIIKLMMDYKFNDDSNFSDFQLLVKFNSFNDTGSDSYSNSLFSIVYNKNNVQIKTFGVPYRIIPYSHIIAPGESIIFTSDSVVSLIKSNFISIYIGILLIQLFKMASLFISSVVFLAIAAFIFKRGIVGNFSMLFKLSLYASTVVAIEGVITSAAGYATIFTWYAAVFVSIFSLFRGLSVIENLKNKHDNKNPRHL